MEETEISHFLHILVRMGEALQNSGAEVFRVEDTLNRIAIAYGAEDVNVFVITSSIVVTLTMPSLPPQTETRRLRHAASNDLLTLEKLNALSRRICTAPPSIEEFQRQLNAILAQHPDPRLHLAGSVLAASSFAIFFGGNLWDGLLAGVDGGRYDSMANGVEITEERAQKYDFSDPYCYIRTAIIVKSDDDSINSFEDLNGKTTANTISSTYATLAESYGAKTTGVDDLNQTIELLLNGRVDATLNAEVTYFDYLKEHPDANIKIAALTNDASQVAFPVRKGDETATLREALNQAINELREDGTIAEISEKYFGTDLSQAPSAN